MLTFKLKNTHVVRALASREDLEKEIKRWFSYFEAVGVTVKSTTWEAS